MDTKEISFYINISKELKHNKRNKVDFDLYKSNNFNPKPKSETIECRLTIPGWFFKKSMLKANLTIKSNGIASGVVEELEEELRKLKGAS